MPREYSPFTPGVPVPIDFFVGRNEEVGLLKRKIEAAVNTGRIQLGYLSGERGIGKSSVASYVRRGVEARMSVLGLHAFLGGVGTLEEMVRRIFERLLKASLDEPWHQKIVNFFGNRVRKVGLFGLSLEFEASRKDLS